jgi:hypothetical protein
MATDDEPMDQIVDVNCPLPLSSAVPSSLGEIWAVDPKERERGSAGGAGPRDLGHTTPTRWQFVAVPPFDGSVVASAIEVAKSPGPRVLRLCPGRHGYPLASWLLAPLPELCDAAEVALVLDYAPPAQAAWTEIVELARRHPSLCLVLAGGLSGQLGVLRAFLDAVANVIVELSGLDDAAWLARTVSELGAHRFVFGSNGDPTRVFELVESASLNQKDARLVLSGVAGLLDAGSWAEAWL